MTLTIKHYKRSKVLEWPYSELAFCHIMAAKENPILEEGDGRALIQHDHDDVECFLIFDNKDCVGACVYAIGDDVHLLNVFSIISAYLLPNYRRSIATSMFRKTIAKLSKGCKWLCRTQYTGNLTYVTKYRRLDNGRSI